LGPEHADDEIVAEDQPYAEDASPNAQSPEYVPESDFEAHPEDDDDEDPEEDPAPSAKETEPFETDESAATPPPHPAYRMTARISIPAPVPFPAWSDLEIVRLLAMSSPPASPLSPCRMEDRPEVTLPPQKRLGIALGPRYEVGESSSAAAARPAGGLRADYGFVAMMDREIMRDPEREVGYGITNSWDEIVETLQGAPVCTDTELGRYMREFETRVRQDTDEIYMRLDDEQTERQLLAELLRTDHRRSTEITKLRTALQGQVTALQGQVTALQAQLIALQGQQGLAGGLTQPELPEEAGIGDSFAGTGYHITGTAWTRWRSYTVRVTRGGW
nr:hypothetical protein [Tanacetum cinerariifolium]